MTFVSKGSMAKGGFHRALCFKKNKPPYGSGNHTAAIYEVKKMKTEDGLFEERNNLLRQVGEEGRDFCKECNNRIHIAAA